MEKFMNVIYTDNDYHFFCPILKLNLDACEDTKWSKDTAIRTPQLLL